MLDIVTYPDPFLRKMAEPVDTIDDDIRNFVEDMTEAMYTYDGVGLAAPQVGRSVRIILVDAGDGLNVVINPVIKEQSKEKESTEEGCLSLPDVLVDISRPIKVTVEGLNEKGEAIRLEADGLLARALQHEIDHLNGKLTIDHASSIQRALLKSKLRKLEKAA